MRMGVVYTVAVIGVVVLVCSMWWVMVVVVPFEGVVLSI